jgi:hypothetical protein
MIIYGGMINLRWKKNQVGPIFSYVKAKMTRTLRRSPMSHVCYLVENQALANQCYIQVGFI